MTCPFCREEEVKKKAWFQNKHFYSVFDINPVSKGHMLVVSKRHTQSVFDLTKQEGEALLDAISKTRELLIKQYNPDGFNIGVNEGRAAGQSIEHSHVHIIPRRSGDSGQNIEGVRNVIPKELRTR